MAIGKPNIIMLKRKTTVKYSAMRVKNRVTQNISVQKGLLIINHRIMLTLRKKNSFVWRGAHV